MDLKIMGQTFPMGKLSNRRGCSPRKYTRETYRFPKSLWWLAFGLSRKSRCIESLNRQLQCLSKEKTILLAENSPVWKGKPKHAWARSLRLARKIFWCTRLNKNIYIESFLSFKHFRFRKLVTLALDGNIAGFLSLFYFCKVVPAYIKKMQGKGGSPHWNRESHCTSSWFREQLFER